jgi:hypothetical protein
MVLKCSLLVLIASNRWSYSFDGFNLGNNKRLYVKFPTDLFNRVRKTVSSCLPVRLSARKKNLNSH